MTNLPVPDMEERDFLARCVGSERLEEFLALCAKYGAFLYETNEHLNLTAIPPSDFWTKHVGSCASILPLPELRSAKRIADVGGGAVLPSSPLAGALPACLVVAIDSRGKKIRFLSQAAELCGLKNLLPVHARANELANDPDYDRSFPIAVARAVGAADVLRKETANLRTKNGRLYLYRTPGQAEEERRKLKCAIRLTEVFRLPHDAGERLFSIL